MSSGARGGRRKRKKKKEKKNKKKRKEKNLLEKEIISLFKKKGDFDVMGEELVDDVIGGSGVSQFDFWGEREKNWRREKGKF